MENLDIDIRYSEEKDFSYLIEWLKDPEDLKYYPMSTPEEIELGAKNWIGFAKYRCSLTALLDKEPCGIATLYLMPYKKVAHLCFFNMIVGKSYRKRGVGTSLLKNLLNLGSKYFSLESIYAEVYEGSPIIPLLKKEGFIEIMKQDHFIKWEGNYLARILFERVF